MKIAFLYSTFPTISTTFLQREVRMLRKSGLDPVLVSNRSPSTGRFHPADRDLLDQTFYLSEAGLPRYLKANIDMFMRNPRRYLSSVRLALRLGGGWPFQRMKNLLRLAGAAVLAKYLREKEVSHVHVHFAFGAAGVAIFLEMLSGIPYGLSIHGSDVLLPQPLIEEKLDRARYIVSNCRYHVDHLRKRFPFLHGEKFHIVRLGLEMRRGLWTCSGMRTRPPPLRILNVARLDRVKAHEILIGACSRLRSKGVPFLCRIAGDGPRRKELTGLIGRLGLSRSVELLGPCYEDEISRLLEWSHVMVLSSRSEGTPMTIIEAMARCRPVLAPNITAIPEMVEHGKTGLLFNSGDPDDLAECLGSLASRPQTLAALGSAGRRKAETMFDPLTNARMLVDIFRRHIRSNTCTDNGSRNG